MKNIFTICFCLLFFQSAFSAPILEDNDIWETAHFKIQSSFKKKDTKKFAYAIEDFAAQAERIYSIKLSQKLSLCLFSSRKDFFKFVKQSNIREAKYAGGFFSHENNLIAVFLQHSEQEMLTTLFHEIAHAYTARAFKQAPQAIHEGLSAFLESSSLRFHKIEIGLIHRRYLELFLKMLEKNTLTPLASFLNIQGYDLGKIHETFGEDQYAEAWALLYYCLRGPEDVQKKFKKYLQSLRIHPDPSGLTFLSLMVENTFQKQWITFMQKIKPDKQDRKNKDIQFG